MRFLKALQLGDASGNLATIPDGSFFMSTRPLKPSQRRWLLDEMDYWRGAGLITDEQIDAILRSYGKGELVEATPEPGLAVHQVAVYTLLSIAAFFVGLAAFLVIGFNWSVLSAAVKLAIIFIAVLGTHGTGALLRYVAKAPILSEVAFFLGCLFYGAGIFLIGQIFHVNAHWPDAFWWWAVGIFPFAIFLRTFLNHLLLVAVLSIWVGSEILAFATFFVRMDGGWFFPPHVAYTLPLFVAAGLFWAYRKDSPLTVGLYLTLLVWWVCLQPIAWRWEENPIMFIGAAGAWLMIIADLHSRGSSYAILYRTFGLMIAFGALVPMSFRDFNLHDIFWNQGHLPRLLSPYIIQYIIIIVGTCLITVLTFFVLRKKLFNREAIAIDPVKDGIRHQWLPFALAGLMGLLAVLRSVTSQHGQMQEISVPITVLVNLVLVATAIWLISLGLNEDRGFPFAGGVLVFLVWSIMRYIDLFGGFGGMLGAACMFFLCGLSLASVAAYWWVRRSRRKNLVR